LKSAGLQPGPVSIIQQGRVAIGDPVAYGLQSKIALMLIGERPGLSAADSIGAYITYDPKPGLTDESRNCVSNIRPRGLSFEKAAENIKQRLTAYRLPEVDFFLSTFAPSYQLTLDELLLRRGQAGELSDHERHLLAVRN
jgi:hypothetical protein